MGDNSHTIKAKIAATTWDRRPGEVDAANRLLSFMETEVDGQVVKPVITEGSIFSYNAQTGIWDEYNHAYVKQLIQGFNGTKIKKYRKDSESGKSQSTSEFSLSSGYVSGAAKSIYNAYGLSFEDFFRHSVDGIALSDGFLKVTKDGMTSVPHSPEHRATEWRSACVEDLKSADLSVWLNTLERIFSCTPEKEKAIMVWQEFMGACLIGKATHYQKCLIFEGPGKNGKSVLCEVLAGLFNPRFVVQIEPSTWHENFVLARLKRAKLNVASELSSKQWEADSKFKKIITGDPDDVREIYGSLFTMYPIAGHIFSTNNEIKTKDLSEAFFRRLLTIQLNRVFDGPDTETKTGVVDRCLAHKNAIILWALEGAVRLLKQGAYTEAASIKARIEEHKKASDPVMGWIDDCCITNSPNALTPLKDLYKAFVTSHWSKGSNITYQEFGRRLTRMKYTKKLVGEKRVTAYLGLALKGALPSPESLFENDAE